MQCRLFYCIMENEQRGMITFILAVCGNVDYVYSFPPSPPSRAAWIEMRLRSGEVELGKVAAFTGGVDRNTAVGDYKRNVPSLHSQMVCMQRFACVICLRSESSLIKNRVTAF